MSTSRDKSGIRRTARSPQFGSLDRKDLWIERTRDATLTDVAKHGIEVEIGAMTDEEVTAALASIRQETSSVLEEEKGEVQDSPFSMPTGVPRPVTVMDIDSDDEDPTDRYSMPFIRKPDPDIPVHPYVSQQRPPVRFGDSVPRDSVPRDVRESTTSSVRARRAPVPTIESQTKPPSKFKGEEMSFVKVDVFLKKMERYLRTGHGLDLDVEDISDYVLDSLDEYAYRWFETLRKPYPYLFRQFDGDLRARYVPLDYKDQLYDEYEAIVQGDDRSFSDYLTELQDYEAMLDDVSLRDKYRILKKGLNDDLKAAMIIFEGAKYKDFVEVATRVDPALMKKRRERQRKKSTAPTSTSTVNKDSKQSPSQSSSQSRRYKPSKSSSPSKKPAVKELKPEVTRQEADRLGLCRHCKEPGHIRRNCPKLQTARQQPASNAISILTPPDSQSGFDQARIPTVNKVRQGYAVKDTRTYRDAALGKPRLEAPSWSIDKSQLSIATKGSSSASTSAASTESALPRLEEPFVARIWINNAEARCLIDTGASGDFVSSHFTYTNHLKHRKLDSAIPIQQAVKGSKPKCNAVATATIHFGDWTRKTSMYVIHLAHYDAIIGLPTLMDAGARFDLATNTLHLQQYDVSLPLERHLRISRPQRNTPAPKSTDRQAPSPEINAATAEKEVPISAEPPSFRIPDGTDKSGSAGYYRDLIYEQYADIFVDKLPARLPPLRVVNHRIPVKVDKPWMAPLYRLPEHQKKQLDADIDLKLRAGIVVPTTELPLATSHMVPKKDPNERRHVQDLRRRNKDTETLVWPLPVTDDIIDDVARSPERSILDLVQSFDQIRVDPADVSKTAFRTHRGNYLHLTTQMGDKNASCTEQQLLDTIFDPIRDIVRNYLDDIMPVNTRTPYEHYIALRKILDILRAQKLYVNRRKSKLFIPYDEPLNILGVEIKNGEITPETTKIEAFNALPSPHSFQELGKILGSFTWLSAHIPASQEIASPLHQLLHGERWFWTDTHENAFQEMKRLVLSRKVRRPMPLLDSGDKVFVFADASLVGCGGMIVAGKSLESAKPVVYHSRVFNPAQSNYPTHEQELLAVVDLLKTYHHLLAGREFILHTDSQAMTSIFSQKHLSPRQARWMLFLSQFAMKIEHIPGPTNTIADLLSRIPEYSGYVKGSLQEPVDVDLPDQQFDSPASTPLSAAPITLRRGKVLLDTPVRRQRGRKSRKNLSDRSVTHAKDRDQAAMETTSETDDIPITPPPEPEQVLPEPTNEPQFLSITIDKYADAIRKGYKTDRLFSKALAISGSNPIYHLHPTSGFLYQNTPSGGARLCIPDIRVPTHGGKTERIRNVLIDHIHETLGHFGYKKTLSSAYRHFYWKTLVSDVIYRVKRCHDCQLNKSTPTARYGLAKPLPVPERPWSIISMDFMTGLPTSQDDSGTKFDSVYIVVCTLSKMCHIIPTTKNVTAQQVARLYYDNIYRLHGLPKAIISDRDAKFTGDFWSTMQRLFGTDLLMSTAYHPQTDGQTERTNRTVLQSLRNYVNRNGSNWAKYVTTVEFAINSAINASTGKAPFEIVYGYLPRILPPVIYDDTTPAAMDFVETRMLHHLEAQDSIIAAKTEQATYMNRNRIDPNLSPRPINVGDYVLRLFEHPAKEDRPARKLLQRWFGPYKVIWHDATRTTYMLDLGNERAHPYFHISRLKLYIGEPTNPQRRPRISTSIGADNLEVGKVIGHRFKHNEGLQFLCQWKDYSIEDSTYRNASDFVEPAARLLVAKYIRGIQNLPRNLETWAMQRPWSLDTTGRLAGSTTTPTINGIYARIPSRRKTPPFRRCPPTTASSDRPFYNRNSHVVGTRARNVGRRQLDGGFRGIRNGELFYEGRM